ncbi:hypothetical protein QN277_007720 [Acacia crassicarpa]|uniref:Transmembrane protein 230 n=1 Tax=Acacia crassicarpa TaxID=499986 RepID=A0AAE1MAS4_9FABA|nr:hypothetical protein QN277_007720 [Acacia crassicarpa]
MAYVDHAFSITDDDLMETSYIIHNKPPIKEIALAISLLVFGTLGLFFAILGMVLFIPGFYYTRIAYYAYKGYKGFSFSNILMYRTKEGSVLGSSSDSILCLSCTGLPWLLFIPLFCVFL